MSDDPSRSGQRPAARRLHQLLDAVEKAGARYGVVGAVALAAHGFRRFTEDIDVLISTSRYLTR